jgi:hypothetical protein
METLTLEINNPMTLHEIATAAARKGVPAKAYVLELVEMALLSQRTFEELAEPMAQSFDESGMTEDELDALIEEERQTIWNERHGKQ